MVLWSASARAQLSYVAPVTEAIVQCALKADELVAAHTSRVQREAAVFAANATISAKDMAIINEIVAKQIEQIKAERENYFATCLENPALLAAYLECDKEALEAKAEFTKQYKAIKVKYGSGEYSLETSLSVLDQITLVLKDKLDANNPKRIACIIDKEWDFRFRQNVAIQEPAAFESPIVSDADTLFAAQPSTEPDGTWNSLGVE